MRGGPRERRGAETTRWGNYAEGRLVAVVALERHGAHGLLRSLAVAPHARGRGLAFALVAHALRDARALGLTDVAGLTTTIPDLLPPRGTRLLPGPGPGPGRPGRMTRVLVLCTHNSACSQMAEGWLRHHASVRGVALEAWSAGTERTFVKPDAIAVMAEVGVDLASHTSKSLDEVADPWAFDVVLTVCDSANEACPVYPARTTRLHVAFPDPSSHPLERWRSVRDAIGEAMVRFVDALAEGRVPTEAEIAGRVGLTGP